MSELTEGHLEAEAMIEPGALAIISSRSLPVILAADENDILGKLQAELASFVPDVTTPKGRKEIASKAYKVAQSKMDLVRLGDKLKEGAQATIKGVNAELKVIQDKMDELRDRVRAPLDEFERAEAARLEAHEAALAAIKNMANFQDEPTSAQVEARIAEMEALPAREWQEFADKARMETAVVGERLQGKLAMVKRREAEAAEQERLRLEAEEAARQEAARIQAERESQIAAEAAERARLEAEAAARRAAEEEARRVEQERLAAERAAREAREAVEAEARRAKEAQEAAEREAARAAQQAEDARIKGHQDALERLRRIRRDAMAPSNTSEVIRHMSATFENSEDHGRDWQEFQPEYQRIVDETRPAIAERLAGAVASEEERARVRAEEQRRMAEAEAEAAAARERKRLDDERAAAAEEARKREANVAHQRSIKSAAKKSLIEAAGLDEDAAIAVVKAIVAGSIEHVTINF